MRWDRSIYLLDQPGTGDAYRAAGLDEPGEVIEVEVVRAVIEERVDGHDGIEEVGGERQCPGVCVDRKDAVRYAGILDPLKVFAGAEPQVGGPDLDAEFATQKDRRHGSTAAQIQ